MTEPLDRGEHVDMDGFAMTVTRGGSVGTAYPENFYKVTVYDAESGETPVILEDEQIRQLAELAGYEVRD